MDETVFKLTEDLEASFVGGQVKLASYPSIWQQFAERARSVRRCPVEVILPDRRSKRAKRRNRWRK